MVIRNAYTRLSEQDQKEVLCRLAHLMRKDEFYYTLVYKLIILGELTGQFDDVKFGGEVNNSKVL